MLPIEVKMVFDWTCLKWVQFKALCSIPWSGYAISEFTFNMNVYPQLKIHTGISLARFLSGCVCLCICVFNACTPCCRAASYAPVSWGTTTPLPTLSRPTRVVPQLHTLAKSLRRATVWGGTQPTWLSVRYRWHLQYFMTVLQVLHKYT